MKKVLITLLLLMVFTLSSQAQIIVTHFNAEWNGANKADIKQIFLLKC